MADNEGSGGGKWAAGGLGLLGIVGVKLALGFAKVAARTSNHAEVPAPSFQPVSALEVLAAPEWTEPQVTVPPKVPTPASALADARGHGARIAPTDPDLAGDWSQVDPGEVTVKWRIHRDPRTPEGVYPIHQTVEFWMDAAAILRVERDGYEVVAEGWQCLYFTRVSVAYESAEMAGILEGTLGKAMADEAQNLEPCGKIDTFTANRIANGDPDDRFEETRLR